MTIHQTFIRDSLTSQSVPAELNDQVSFDEIIDAEDQWASTRRELIRTLRSQEVQPALWPQSIRWNWSQKVMQLDPSQLERGGDVRLLGIKHEGIWQGALYADIKNYGSRSVNSPSPLIYVDFLEIAPWNWDIKPLKKTGRFRGIGLQLIASTVRLSFTMGYAGRLGLHALPQADSFYSQRLKMKDFGPDSDYGGLYYYELDESQAQAFLRAHQ